MTWREYLATTLYPQYKAHVKEQGWASSATLADLTAFFEFMEEETGQTLKIENVAPEDKEGADE